MAGVRLHNSASTSGPPSPSDFERPSHRPDHSLGSTTSGITASDGTVGQQGGTSSSNSQLLRNLRGPGTSDTSTHLQSQDSYARQERKSTHLIRTRTLRAWLYARLGLRAAVLCWVMYCTVRYFIAVRIYRGDHVRSQYALGMGIASAFTIVFFVSETSITLWFPENQFYRRLRTIVHSLAYLSSALVLGLTIINIVLVNVWRTPHNPSQFGRSVQGRCHWDLDVVWSGTGMACARGDEKPFSDWLNAAILRSVVSAVLIIAYHLTMHVYSANRAAQQASAAVGADMGELVGRRPSMPAMRPLQLSSHSHDPSLVPVAFTVSEDELRRRSLSFTAAGQVLSRIEGSELDEDGHASSTASSSSEKHQRPEESVHSHMFNRNSSIPPLRSESPESISPTENHHSAPLYSDMTSYLPQPGSSLVPHPESGELAPNPPPSTYLRNITTPSNDLQDFASAFQNLVSHSTRETLESLSLDNSTRTSRPTVRVLGSYISRMSTIDSMASREASSPARSPSSSDTNHSNGSGSRNLSMDPTVSNRGRDPEEFLEISSPPGTGSADGQSSL